MQPEATGLGKKGPWELLGLVHGHTFLQKMFKRSHRGSPRLAAMRRAWGSDFMSYLQDHLRVN